MDDNEIIQTEYINRQTGNRYFGVQIKMINFERITPHQYDELREIVRSKLNDYAQENKEKK